MSNTNNSPIEVSLEADRTYYWCACGKSGGQPLCDGAHKGSSVAPLAFKVDDNKQAWLCSCKKTKNPPYCDGSHNS